MQFLGDQRRLRQAARSRHNVFLERAQGVRAGAAP